MQVFVRGPGNTTLVVDVSAHDTVLALKQLLWARLRIPVENMWLDSGGRVLHDQLTLRESGVYPEHTVWCHIRAGNGRHNILLN
jgi:hypothetical protein